MFFIKNFYKVFLFYLNMKNRGIFIIFCIFLIIILNLFFVNGASQLVINGAVNNYSSDVRLKINSDSTNNFDNYDFSILSSDNPSDYAQFYSNVSTNSSSDYFSIDSWNGAERTFYLVYSMLNPQTGTLTFSWNDDFVSANNYNAVIYYYGNDSSYNSLVGSANIGSSSSYSVNLNDESIAYAKVILTRVITAVIAAGSSGGGGGYQYATFTLNENEFKNGNSQSLKVLDRFKINISNEYHYVIISNINEKSIDIDINSKTKSATLRIKEEQKFDVNEDSYLDLAVKLNSIDIENKKANLTIRQIDEIPPLEKPAINVKDFQNFYKGSIDALKREISRVRNDFKIALIFICLVIILFVIMAFLLIVRNIRGKGNLEKLSKDKDNEKDFKDFSKSKKSFYKSQIK